MPRASPNDAEIRVQAYLFWEQDGRPAGRDIEYWSRAEMALSPPAKTAAARPNAVKAAAVSAAKPAKKAGGAKAAVAKAK